MSFLNRLSWPLLIVVSLTLGLAPFSPEPHVWEKIQLLLSGELKRAVDIFDLLMHGTPWLLLLAKIVVTLTRPRP